MVARRVYGALLRLLPGEMRGRFGHEMEEVFLARLERARSLAGRVWVWARAVADVVGVAVGERWVRRTSGGGGMEGWVQDARQAGRTLRRSPGFSALVAGTLALGIGTSTATFSVVNGVLLKPLPYAAPRRLVSVWPEQIFNPAMVRDLLAAAPALESATGIAGWTFTLTGEGEPLQLDGARVSPGHFRVLGVRPALGRDFTEGDGLPGHEPVAIISHGLWVRAFGADAGVIGRTVALSTNDVHRHRIVGVLPPGFRPVEGHPDVWIPLVLAPSTSVAADSAWYVNARVARLAPGATVEQASEQVRAFARGVRSILNQAIEPESVDVAGVRPLRSALAGDLVPVLWVALGAVALVLLIACANVANLLLARGEARQADLSVRAALGAGRGRIARLLLLESALLGAVGGTLGIALSYGLVRAAISLAPAGFPRLGDVAVDGGVLAFGLAATAASTALAALVPALRVSRTNSGGPPRAARSASALGASRLATTLVGVEVALAIVVAVGSGLMVRSLVSMTSQDPGLDGRGVLVLRPNPPEGRYPNGPAFHAYYDDVLERVRALPAVERASAIHLLPATGANWSFPTFIEGVDVAPGKVIPSVNFRLVWPGYFETVGVKLVQGRTLTPADDAGAARAVVVNEAFVRRFWPSEPPLGRELRLLSTETEPYRVVGVVQDVRQQGLAHPAPPAMYFTHAQVTWNAAFWIVARIRGDGSPLREADDVRGAVWSVDPDVPIDGVDELARVVGASAATTRFVTLVLGAFGALALLLSAVGVFAVTAYGVGRRMPEFGVRIALGASRAEVVRSALAGSALAVSVGLGGGLLAASFSTRALAAALYQVEPTDAPTFGAVAALLLVVAGVAALVPALRAGQVDPADALRGD